MCIRNWFGHCAKKYFIKGEAVIWANKLIKSWNYFWLNIQTQKDIRKNTKRSIV